MIAVTANPDGTEIIPLFFVVSSQRPRCFGKQTDEDLSLDYASSRSAWMTCSLFMTWIKTVNEHMKGERRHILLLLDNTTAHHVDV